MSLRVGQPAPDFSLKGIYNDKFEQFKLSDYRGRWVVLFFYPLDFTFVCPTEIREFSRRKGDFENLNAVVLGASVDSVHSHQAWIKSGLGKVNYPLLSDLNKEASTNYNVLSDEGTAFRGTFIIDPDGILRWMTISDMDAGRSVAETLRSLAALQTGGLCQVEWQPGQETLSAN